MIITTDRAVDQLVDGVRKLGSGGGFALAGMGLSGGGAGDRGGGLELLMVETSKGACLGGNVARMVMAADDELNQAAYDSAPDITGILSDAGGKLDEASALRSKLQGITQRAWGM